MSVPFDTVVPSPLAPPLDNPLRGPDRIAGEEPLPDPKPDEDVALVRRASRIDQRRDCRRGAFVFRWRTNDERPHGAA
jgi:hypothetical protein